MKITRDMSGRRTCLVDHICETLCVVRREAVDHINRILMRVASMKEKCSCGVNLRLIKRPQADVL